ncbi:MAG: hypothetical protein E7214_03520, partial [Clostridium sp.]|nr:hypothetical protein [Clostridium sp.]
MKRILSFILVIFMECTVIFNALLYPISVDAVVQHGKECSPVFNLYKMFKELENYNSQNQEEIAKSPVENTGKQIETKEEPAEQISADLGTKEKNNSVTQDENLDDLSKVDDNFESVEYNDTLLSLSTPTGLRTIETSNFIVIVWNAVDYAEKYELEVDGQIIDCSNKTMYVQSDLTDMRVHKYRVRAVNSSISSDWSTYIEGSLDEGVFDSPCDIITFPTSNYIILCWSTVNGATGYEVEVDGKVINNGLSTNYIHQGLTPNTTHTYRVRAIEGENYTKWSNFIKETTLAGIVEQKNNNSIEEKKGEVEKPKEAIPKTPVVQEENKKTIENKTEKIEKPKEEVPKTPIIHEEINKAIESKEEKEKASIENVTTEHNENKIVETSQNQIEVATNNEQEMLKKDQKEQEEERVRNDAKYNSNGNNISEEANNVKDTANIAEELNNNLAKAYNKLEEATNVRISNSIAEITSSINAASITSSYDVNTSEIEYKAEGFYRSTGGATVDRWERLGENVFAEVSGAPMEKLRISSIKKPNDSITLKYQVYVYDKDTGNGGWQSERSEGEEAGEYGKVITSLKIWLEGTNKYEVRYNSITDMTSSVPGISDYVYNGEQTLDPSINKQPILNFIFEVIESLPKVEVSTYNNTTGKWTSTKDEDGFIGESNPVGKIKLTTNKVSQGFKLKYQVFIKENGAWQDWKYDGEEAGEAGKTITNIRAKVEGTDRYSLIYKFKSIDDKSKISISEYGKNGYEPKSLKENSNNITGFFFKVLRYVPNIDVYTYCTPYNNEKIWIYGGVRGEYGPIKFEIRKIKISLKDAPSDTNIKYQVYLKNKNVWQEWKSNGEIAGLDDDYITNIRIKLDGETLGNSIKYYFKNTDDDSNQYVSNYGYNGVEPAGSSANDKEISSVGIFMCNDQPISNLDVSGDTIVLDGKYEIPQGTEFTIPSGKKIVLDYSKTKNVGFVVNGTLIFNGTENNQIKVVDDGEYSLFTIGETGKLIGNYINVVSNRGYGIESLINNKGELVLSNSSFKNSVSGTYFLESNSSKNVKVDSCIVDTWAYGMIIDGTGNFIVNKSTIKNCKTAIIVKDGNGYSSYNKIQITNNQIMNNDFSGIYVNRVGEEALHKKLEIESNIFDGNDLSGLEFYSDSLANIIVEKNKIRNTNKYGDNNYSQSSSKITAPISINLGILKDKTKGSINFINSINKTDEGSSNKIEAGNSIDAIVLYNTLRTTLQLKSGKYQFVLFNMDIDNGGSLLIDEGCKVIFDGIIYVKKGQLIINGSEINKVLINPISSSGVTYTTKGIMFSKNSYRIKIEEGASINATHTTFFRGGIGYSANFDVLGAMNLNNCIIDNDVNTNVNGISGNSDKTQISLSKVVIRNCATGLEGKCGKVIGCTFTNNNCAIKVSLGECEISNCTIINNKNTGIQASVNTSIYNSTIKSNINNIDLSAKSSGVKFTLYNNTISDANYGIKLVGTANVDIRYNNIYNHKTYGLSYTEGTRISVPYNYWGNSNGPSAYYWYTDYYGKRHSMYKTYGDKISNNSNNIDFSPCCISLIQGIDLGINPDQISNDAYKLLSDYAYNLKKSLSTNGVNAASGNYSKVYNDLLVNSKGIDINLSRIYSSRNNSGITTVTIRSEASETSNKIGTLNKGDTVEVLETLGSWCKIKVNNLVGYVNAANLDITQSTVNLNVLAEIKLSTSSSVLNVRSSASTSSSIIGTLGSGARVTVLGIEGNWFRINFNGRSGYVSMDYSKLCDSDPLNATGSVKVSSSTGYLNVRSEPNTSCTIIGKLYAGNTINITAKGGDWYRINYNGSIGYVNKDYVVVNSVVTTTIKKSGVVKVNDLPNMLGRGWTFYYESSLEGISDVSSSVTTEGKVVTLPGGEVCSFKKNSDGTYTALDSRNTLTESNGEFIIKNKENISYYFNNLHKLYKILDSKNNALYFEYSGKLITKIYDDSGRIYNLNYSGGLLTNITEVIDGKNRRTINYNFNSNNMLESVKDINGNIQEKYIYDCNSRLYQIKQDDTVLEEITYITEGDNDGKISTLKTVSGLINKYTYDNDNNLVTITDNLGNTNQTVYDSSLNVIYTIDQDGNITVNNYVLNSNKDNAYKELASQKDKYGYVTSYVRDDRGNILTIYYPDNSYKEYVYDKFNNVIEEINQNGNKTFYEYDSTGVYLLKIIMPLNGTDDYTATCDKSKFAISTFEYYEKSAALPIAGLVKKITKASGGCVEYTYDKYGNTLSETDLLGNVTKYSYDRYGNRIKIISPNGFSTVYSYDNKGKILTKSNALGQITQYLYDKYDRNIGQIDPKNINNGVITMSYTYDSAGKVISQTDSLGNVIKYSYDEYGNKVSEENALGGTFIYEYDSLGRVISISFRESDNIKRICLQEFSYKSTGGNSNQTINVVKTTKTYIAEGKYSTTVDKYNYLNSVIEHINADGSKEFTTYDGKGNILCKVPENGAPTYCYYDYNNKLIKYYEAVKVGENNNFKYRETKYTYNLDGIKTSVSVGLELVDRGREASKFYTTTYKLDKRGSVLSQVDSEGRKIEYTYDVNGNTTSKKQYLDKDNYILTEYEYDRGSRLIAESIIVKNGDLAGNDISDTTISKLTTKYTYDKNDNVIKKEFADGSTLETEYDGLNRAVKHIRTIIGKDIANKVIKETYSYVGNTDKVAKFTNGEGDVTTNIYNKQLQLIEVDYADGSVVTYKYNLEGKEISKVIKDASAGNTKEYVKEYDADGNLILEQYVSKDASGKVIYYPVKAYKYNSQGNLIKEVYGKAFAAATGNTTEEKIKNAKGIEYTYNLENKIVSVLNIQDKLDGKKYSSLYEYDVLGRKIKETDSKGNSTLYVYDMAGNVLEKYFVGNVNGNENIKILLKKNTYDLANNVISSTDANGNRTEYVINSFGKIKFKKLPGDTTIPSSSCTYQYDKSGNNSMSIDSLGLITKTVYDSAGDVILKTLQGKGSNTVINEKYAYDNLGNVTSYTDANGNVTTYKYDIYGKVIEKSINGKVVFKYSYDFFNNMLYVEDRYGNKTTYIYDDGERLIETRNAYGVVIEKYEYDLNGNKISTTDSLGNVSRYTYDENDRVISSKDPEGIITTKSYNSLGQVISQKDGNGNITYYSYDGLGRLISVKNALGETTIYTYDFNGNKISVTDAKGNITKYNYNAANKVTEIIAPNNGSLEGKVQKYTYNADGSIKNVKDRNGNVISYNYDIFGRKIKETNGSSIVNYEYDKLGNLLKVTNNADPTGDITYSYDSENRITEKTVAAITIKYTYDVKGKAAGEHKTIITDNKGGKVTETYDKANRLISVDDGKDETKYTYLSDGTKSSTIFSDGSKETYSYNKNTQLITLNHINAAGKITATYSYTYDKNNNITKVVDSKGTTSYIYDGLNRLIQVTEPDGKVTVYKYDKAGNRSTETVTKDGKTYNKAYVYDIENRLVKTVDNLSGVTLETNYTFDNNGNQVRELVRDSSLTKVVKDRNITYDNYNRVIVISQDGKTLEKNAYNYEGLRVLKETDGKKVIYIYDGKNVFLELNDSSEVNARNVYGTKLISRETGGVKGFYRYNGHGDVVKIVDKAGNTLAEYYYDAFGTVKESKGSFNNPYRYAGYIYDEEADYYYMQSRMYDPSLGRFIQQDTYRGEATDPLSLNLYTYCLNNPMIYDDQNGHWGSWISNAWNAIKSVGRKVINTVRNVVHTVVNTVRNVVNTVVNAVKNVVHRVVNTVKNVVRRVANTVKRAVRTVSRTVRRVVSRTASTVKKIVRHVAQNRYVQSAVAKARLIANYTSNQMKKAINAVKKVNPAELAVGAFNMIQGGLAIGAGLGLTAV